MKPENAGKLKYGGWGLVCGAIIAMIIGFGWGGWSTAGTSQKMTEDAVLTSQAAICIAQFMKGTEPGEKLKEFEIVGRWDRDDFIREGGWDKMPGQEKAEYSVARACSDGIALLVSK